MMRGALIIVCSVVMVTLGSWEGYRTHEGIAKNAIPIIGLILGTIGVTVTIHEAENRKS